ncbi:MAG: o-succinylbenzoate--CoA ligase [Omnitrophica WOR_2 bacterium RIFCSPHIGHO2_02_FULL_52_10]|nr:MAG: o-succinylbenzoate--CoA ligase [Omnitrophica WOR_2 bacterium RIFCSPHIGHO2_02_FULL_52_10]
MTPRYRELFEVNPTELNLPAVVAANQGVTYAQLFNAVRACADKLHAAGVKAKDRIATVEPNTIDHVVLLLALWSIKAVACPLSARLSPRAIESQLSRIQAKRVTSSKFVEQSSFSVSAPPIHGVSYEPSQAGTILFTSGTGAAPKAVLHTLGNHIASAHGANACVALGPGARWLLSLPLYHVGGLGILFRCFLARASVAIPQTNEMQAQSLAGDGITHMSLVATQLFRLLNATQDYRPLRKLKAILVGGGPIPRHLLDTAAAAGLPVYTTYGMTEMASQIATARYPLPATVLRKRKVKISPEGEILVKGETLCAGYVNGGEIKLPVDKDGWFATGDLGTLNRQKHLTVVGRKDNMFISGGENIQPEEIEGCLNNYGVIENCVVIPKQSEEFGFRPVAFIQGRTGGLPGRAGLDRYLLKHLPKFKIPDHYYVWPDSDGHSPLKTSRRDFAQRIQGGDATLQEIN